jgi:hypothetical protein
MTGHQPPERYQPTRPGTISIGYTRSDRKRGPAGDYIPSVDGYQPGAAQDVVTIEVPQDSRLGQLPIHDLAEAVFVATNAPYPSLRDGTPGAHEIAEALNQRTDPRPVGRRGLRSLSVGDTVTAHGHTFACLPVGFAEVPGYQPPGKDTTRTPQEADFLTHVITTAVEGGINHWASVSGYHWHFPDLDGGTARPGPGGSANAYVTVHENDTEGQGRSFILGLNGIEQALRRITVGPVEHMSEQRRERIRRAFHGDEDARTDLDAFDAEEVVQVACFGKVLYG